MSASALALHRILIVDDNADNTDLLAELLEGHGHRCERAYTGAQALELVPIFRPTVLLLDIGLPDIDGYRVAREVRELHGSQIYIAAITGWGKAEDRDRALAAGIDEHVAKPVESVTLDEILMRAARHRTT